VRKSLENLKYPAVLFVIALLLYFPILYTPIAADDMWLSLIPEHFGEGWNGWLNWMTDQWNYWQPRGRFIFVGLIYNSVWQFIFETRIQLKLMYFIINITFVIYLYHYFLKILRNKQISISIALVFLALSQLLGGYDPRSQFYGVIILSTIISMAGIKQIIFLPEVFKISDFTKFLFIILIGVAVYELSVISLPFVLAISYLYRKNNFKVHFVYLLSTLIVIISILTLKLTAPIKDSYTVKFDAKNFYSSYKLTLRDTITYGPLSNIILGTFGVGVVYLYLKYVIKYSKNKLIKSEPAQHNLFVFNLFMVAFLTLPIPSLLTTKYSSPVNDAPYIHIFQQQVFFSISAGILIYLIQNNFSRFFGYILIFCQLILTYNHNVEFITINNFTKNNLGDQSIFGFQRELTEKAVKKKVFDEVLSERKLTRIWAGDSKPWLTQNYIINDKKLGVLLNSAEWWGDSSNVPILKCPEQYSKSTQKDCVHSKDIVFYLISNSFNHGFIVFHMNAFDKSRQNEEYIIYNSNSRDSNLVNNCFNEFKDIKNQDGANVQNFKEFQSKVNIDSLTNCLSM
jgi:hypothetical protein